MLVANKKNGDKLVLVENWQKTDLVQIRKKEAFTCPGCHEPVVLRLGEKRIPHFAHLKSTKCSSFSENESQYHLTGKMQIFSWLNNQQLNVELEPYLPTLKQRPDIMLKYHNKKIVIEYQCSTIPEQVFTKRSETYLINGYTPLWIMAASKLQRKSTYNFHISSFQWLFAQKSRNQNQPYILAYCPNEQHLIKLTNLYSFSSFDLIGSINVSSINDLQIGNSPFGGTSKPEAMKEIWYEKKKKWCEVSSVHPNKNSRHFFEELYQHHIPPIFIPSEAGIPVPSSYWIETPIVIWQMYILLDAIIPLRIGELVTFQTVYSHIKNRKQRGLIKIRSLPLINDTHYSFAIMEYLHALVQLGILKKCHGSTFKKLANIHVFTNVEDQHFHLKGILTLLF